MTNCPHHTIAHGRFTACALVPGIIFGNQICGQCEPQWPDGTPPDKPTPVLLEAIARHGGSPKVSNLTPVGRGECLHLGLATGKGSCCGNREYRCDLHVVTTMRLCQVCGEWEG